VTPTAFVRDHSISIAREWKALVCAAPPPAPCDSGSWLVAHAADSDCVCCHTIREAVAVLVSSLYGASAISSADGDMVDGGAGIAFAFALLCFAYAYAPVIGLIRPKYVAQRLVLGVANRSPVRVRRPSSIHAITSTCTDDAEIMWYVCVHPSLCVSSLWFGCALSKRLMIG